MSQPEQKIVQYLNEAHASEVALVNVLAEQIAMAPRGPLRIAGSAGRSSRSSSVWSAISTRRAAGREVAGA